MFWLIAAAMTLVTLAMIVPVVLRRNVATTKAAELDLQVYKDQLAEVEKDVASGALPKADAQAIRIEVSRRILAADKRKQAETAASQTSRTTGIITGVILVLFIGAGTVALYWEIGVPGMPDQPLVARMEAAKLARENRPDQETAEAAAPPLNVDAAPEYVDLVGKLRKVLQTRTDDVKGYRLLANHEARLGNLKDARIAQQKVIDLLGDKATAEDYTDLAEIMIVGAAGYVSPEAETALAKAIRLQPKSPRARYYSGLTLAQNGRPDIAYRMWQGLLDEGPKDAPWIALIQAQIGSVARAAGIRIPNQNAPGPSAEQVRNAQSMSEEDRQQMIRGMVAGLSERLNTDGGTPAEWARLIRAYGVLGETSKADAAWKAAKEAHGQDADAMRVLQEAAQAAEVTR